MPSELETGRGANQAGNDNAGSSTLARGLREWPALLARYAWTRPLAIQVAGILAIAYTIVVVVDGGYAVARWVFALASVLLGWGLIASASRLGESNKFTPRPTSVFEPVSWLEVLLGRLPVRVARRVQTAIGVIFGAVGVLFGALSVLAL
jgi:hypothetical protein